MEKKDMDHDNCPLFGVESGAPVIGLGILLILFGFVPVFIIRVSFPLPLALFMAGFGFFLIWAGLTR